MSEERTHIVILGAGYAGMLAILARVDGKAHNILTLDVRNGQIQSIRIVANPDWLRHL